VVETTFWYAKPAKAGSPLTGSGARWASFCQFDQHLNAWRGIALTTLAGTQAERRDAH
jgi:hypothetical protein